MNKKTAAQLFKLMEAKKQLEQARHASIAYKQQEALDKAEALKQEAFNASAPITRDVSTAALKHAAAYCGALLTEAREKHSEAEALENDKREQEMRLRTSLQKEMATEQLLHEAGNNERKQRNNKEETARELARSQRRGAN